MNKYKSFLRDAKGLRGDERNRFREKWLRRTRRSGTCRFVPKGAQRSDDEALAFNTNIGLFPTAAITPTSPRPVEWPKHLRQAAQIPSKVWNKISLLNWSRNVSFCLWQKAAFSQLFKVSLTWNNSFYWTILKVPNLVYLCLNDGCSCLYKRVASTSLAVWRQTLFCFPDKMFSPHRKMWYLEPYV